MFTECDGYNQRWLDQHSHLLPRLKTPVYMLQFDEAKYIPPQNIEYFSRKDTIASGLKELNFESLLKVLNLNDRECKILTLLCIEGLTQRKIARRLGVSPQRIHQILQKLKRKTLH